MFISIIYICVCVFLFLYISFVYIKSVSFIILIRLIDQSFLLLKVSPVNLAYIYMYAFS